MLGLLIETSTERAIAALFNGTTTLFQIEMPKGYANAQKILPEIAKGLKALQLDLSHLAYLAVGIGPGSYTGIRIGVTLAKTLAFAKDLPLVGLCTLHTFLPSQQGKFCILIDAKIGGAYFVTGYKQGDQLIYTCEPQVKELAHLFENLKDAATLVTPCATQLRPKLEKLYPQIEWTWEEAAPHPLQMGSLAQKECMTAEFAKKQKSENYHLPILYLRKTQAELEKENKEMREQ